MLQPLGTAVLESLCSELRGIVEAELARGNVITEASTTWGLGGGTVWLMRQPTKHALSGGVTYSRLADFHDGFGQFVCQRHRQIVICGLAT